MANNPVVQSIGTVAAVTSGSISHTPPASTGANDIIILAVLCWLPNTVSPPVADIPTPTATGITFALIGSQIATPVSPTVQGKIAFFWGRATGAVGTITCTRGSGWDTGTDGVFACQSWRATGCITTGNPWAAVQVNGPSNSTTVTYLALSFVGGDYTLFAVQAIQDNVATATPPTSYSVIR